MTYSFTFASILYSYSLQVEEDMSKAARGRRRELEKLMKTVKVNKEDRWKRDGGGILVQ
jgi:hypothetical protein